MLLGEPYFRKLRDSSVNIQMEIKTGGRDVLGLAGRNN
jgi:hypothetical protein